MPSRTYAKVGQKYAKGLFDCYKNPADLRVAIDELKAFVEAMSISRDLESALTAVVFTEEKRRGVLEAISEKLKLGTVPANFLKLLLARGRMAVLPAIVEKLETLYLESQQGTQLRVVSASALSKDERKSVEDRFAKTLGKKVEATYAEDASLIAGIKVWAGGRTYDGSVCGWLDTLEEKLVGGNL